MDQKQIADEEILTTKKIAPLQTAKLYINWRISKKPELGQLWFTFG